MDLDADVDDCHCLLVELHLFAPYLKLSLVRKTPKSWQFKYSYLVELQECIYAEISYALF